MSHTAEVWHAGYGISNPKGSRPTGGEGGRDDECDHFVLKLLHVWVTVILTTVSQPWQASLEHRFMDPTPRQLLSPPRANLHVKTVHCFLHCSLEHVYARVEMGAGDTKVIVKLIWREDKPNWTCLIFCTKLAWVQVFPWTKWCKGSQ